jgi:hypothetical protein
MNKKLNEAYVPADKATWLLRQGLGSDATRLTWYLQCLQNPRGMVKQVAFRDFVGELLENFTNWIFSDSVAYARLAQYLLTQNRPMTIVAGKAFESIVAKAFQAKIPIETLIEVYNRGYNDPNRGSHLTPEQQAFNRVNSYIAGGKARQLDADLTGEETLNNDNKTLTTIKRVLKDKT